MDGNEIAHFEDPRINISGVTSGQKYSEYYDDEQVIVPVQTTLRPSDFRAENSVIKVRGYPAGNYDELAATTAKYNERNHCRLSPAIN